MTLEIETLKKYEHMFESDAFSDFKYVDWGDLDINTLISILEMWSACVWDTFKRKFDFLEFYTKGLGLRSECFSVTFSNSGYIKVDFFMYESLEVVEDLARKIKSCCTLDMGEAGGVGIVFPRHIRNSMLAI